MSGTCATACANGNKDRINSDDEGTVESHANANLKWMEEEL